MYNLLRTTPRLRRPVAVGAAPSSSQISSDLEILGIPTDDLMGFKAQRGSWGKRVTKLAVEGGGFWENVAATDPEGARGE